MVTFLKMIAAVLIAVVLHQVLEKRDKEISLLLSTAVCCMVMICAIGYLKPVTDFLETLQRLGNLDGNILSVLLKCAGIGLLAELGALICSDTGNVAMGKTLQILAVAVILWMSLPLFTSLLEMVEEIMGEA